MRISHLGEDELLERLRGARQVLDADLLGLAASPAGRRLCVALLAGSPLSVGAPAVRGEGPAGAPEDPAGAAEMPVGALAAPADELLGRLRSANPTAADPLLGRLEAANPVAVEPLGVARPLPTAAGALASAARQRPSHRLRLAHPAADCLPVRRTRRRAVESFGLRRVPSSAPVLTADDAGMMPALRAANPVAPPAGLLPPTRELSPATVRLREAILAGELAVAPGRPRRGWRRPAVLVPVAAAFAVAAAAATYSAEFLHVRQPQAVECFASAKPGAASVAAAPLDGSAVQACAALFASGAFGSPTSPPPLVACVLPSGAYAVLPASSDKSCTTRGLAAALPLTAGESAIIDLQAVLTAQVNGQCVAEQAAGAVVTDAFTRLHLQGWTVHDAVASRGSSACVQAALLPDERVVQLFFLGPGADRLGTGNGSPSGATGSAGGATGSPSASGATGASSTAGPTGGTTGGASGGAGSTGATSSTSSTVPAATPANGGSGAGGSTGANGLGGRTGPPPRSHGTAGASSASRGSKSRG